MNVSKKWVLGHSNYKHKHSQTRPKQPESGIDTINNSLYLHGTKSHNFNKN